MQLNIPEGIDENCTLLTFATQQRGIIMAHFPPVCCRNPNWSGGQRSFPAPVEDVKEHKPSSTPTTINSTPAADSYDLSWLILGVVWMITLKYPEWWPYGCPKMKYYPQMVLWRRNWWTNRFRDTTGFRRHVFIAVNYIRVVFGTLALLMQWLSRGVLMISPSISVFRITSRNHIEIPLMCPFFVNWITSMRYSHMIPHSRGYIPIS